MATHAPDDQVWSRGLHWIEATAMQMTRFEDSFYAYQLALMDAEKRKAFDGDTERQAQWDAAYPAYSYDRPIRVPTVALAIQYGADLDFLLVAVNNVMRAQARLPDAARTALQDGEILYLMRNLVEHFDETNGPSALRLAADYPKVEPGAIVFTKREMWIGTVPLSRVDEWLAHVKEAFLSALEGAQIEIPDDMDSTVEGDDAIVWPPDRLRYRLWALPPVEANDYLKPDDEGLPMS